MKKGFTLAELMGVIVILGIIATIVTLAIDSSIKNSRYETCLVQEKNIIEGAKAWSVDNWKKLPNLDKPTVTISLLNDLEKGGYVEEGLINPMTQKEYSGTSVKIFVSTKPVETCYTHNKGQANEETVCENVAPTGKDYQYEVIYGTGEKCAK